jgi:hypothetical protein
VLKLIINIAIIYIIFGHISAFGQLTITSTASAQIVPFTAITEVRQLSFGQFTPLGGGGTIIITPQGNRTTTGSIILKESTVSQNIFSISGSEKTNVSVILPENLIYLYHQNGVNSMYLDSWTANIPQEGSTSVNQNIIIKIGCTLNIASIEANPVGIYQGSYPLTFIFN